MALLPEATPPLVPPLPCDSRLLLPGLQDAEAGGEKIAGEAAQRRISSGEVAGDVQALLLAVPLRGGAAARRDSSSARSTPRPTPNAARNG